MNKAAYYKHSGTVGSTGPILMTVLGILTGLIGGVIYGFAMQYCPLIYLNAIIMIGFGCIVGVATGMGAKKGKVRSNTVVMIFGAITGLIAIYAGWISWIYAFTQQKILIFSPLDIFEVATIIAEKGAWSIKGATPTGVVLMGLWGIELLCVVGAASYIAKNGISQPFCERCDKWVEHEVLLTPLTPILDPGQFIVKLESGDMTPITELVLPPVNSKIYSTVTLEHCDSCTENYFVSATISTITEDKDKKETTNTVEILKRLIITRNQFDEIKSMKLERSDSQPSQP